MQVMLRSLAWCVMTNYNAVIIMLLRCGHVFIVESIGRVLYINNPGNTHMCMFAVSGLIEEGNSTRSESNLTVLSGSGSYRCGSSKESDFKGDAGCNIGLFNGWPFYSPATQNPSHLESGSQRKREGIRLQPLKVRSGLLASINSLVIKCKHVNLLQRWILLFFGF